MSQPPKPLQHWEKKAYQRGFQRGSNWPLHKPPIPPEPVVAELVEALRALRDAVDGALASFDPDDPLNAALSPYIERADKAQRGVSLWLLDRQMR
jgi:hypothetical protein